MARDLILTDAFIWAIAQNIILSGNTIRKTAELFGVSKSTVHRGITLFRQSEQDYMTKELDDILAQHVKDRAHNGGMATKRSWEALKLSQKKLDQITIDDYDVPVPQH